VPEKLALDQVLGDRGTVELDEGCFDPGAPGVDGVGEHLLSSARFAEHEHRQARSSHLPSIPNELDDSRFGARLEPVDGFVCAPRFRHQQPVVLVDLVSIAIEQERQVGQVQREGHELAVDAGELHDLLTVGAAHAPIERDQAQVTLSGEQWHDHAGVTVRQIEHAVVRVALFARVVMLLEREWAP
jgi:hypothetical protein